VAIGDTCGVSQPDIFVDLVLEYDRIEGILESLSAEQWQHASSCEGWSVADVVLHLAQTEEMVATTIAAPLEGRDDPRQRTMTVDESQERLVRAGRTAPNVVFERWRRARQASVAALVRADPDRYVRWADWPLRPRTLATTRLAEHWAHTLDVTDPLGIPYPDDARLWHIARLGFRTLPYGFGLRGEPAQDVFCDLTGPNGEQWTFGDPGAPSTISGAAGAFCRVGAQRLAPTASGLTTAGPHGDAALGVLRNYAY